MEGLFILLGTFAIVIPISFLRAFVLSVLWGWFVVPLGVPEIGIIGAWGLFVTVSLFNDWDNEDYDQEKAFKYIGKMIGRCAIALLIGYILHII